MKAAEAKPARVRTRKVRGSRVQNIKTGEVVEAPPHDVAVTGPEAELNCLAARIAPVFGKHVEFYAKEYGEAKDKAPRQRAEDLEEYRRAEAPDMPPEQLTWAHFSAVARVDVKAAVEMWERVKQAARENVATGNFITDVVYPTAKPFERARQFAVREEMADGWSPQNGIEHALIDTLALTYGLWLHWTGLAHVWATSFCEREEHQRDHPYYGGRKWKPPRVEEAEAVEQAHRFADSYNRQFLRTLRQLRDLRRYAPPTIINNGGQVNVAQNQVNAQRAG